MAITYAIYSGTTWKVPPDCKKIQIECVGSGSNNGNGGAYSKTQQITVTPGSTIYLQIGANGGDTWVNVTSNSTPGSTSVGCLASGGNTDPGLHISSGLGDLKYRGGFGNVSYGFGGGAAGPNGNGGDAVYDSGTGIFIAGGANNGGPFVTSTSYYSAVAGQISTFGFDYVNAAYGSYGGSTPYNDGCSINGGGGGGQAPQFNNSFYFGGFGAVYISFTPSFLKAGTYQEVVTTIGAGIFRFPLGTTQITFEGIGAGASGNSYGTATAPINGGGGGGYARTTLNFNRESKSKIAWLNVGYAVTSSAFKHTWANITSNAEPTSSAQGIRAASASDYRGGGIVTSNIGQVVALGGYGGLGMSTTSANHKGGGGGGAAYNGFAGGTGGNAYSYTTTTGGSGGGGGGSASTAAGGTGGTGTSAGTGGVGGTGGGAGGAGGTTTTLVGSSGTNGGGGGAGAYKSATQGLSGAAGSTYQPASWPSGYGPGGGGGGGGSNTTNSGGTGGAGGTYGGGGGAGDNIGNGGQGIIVITYTIKTGSFMPFFI
jgi:hypothetical protein